MSGTYCLVTDAGHLIPMERPREVTRIIGNTSLPCSRNDDLPLIPNKKEAMEIGRKAKQFIPARFRRECE